jgi:hypothetical protein
MSLIQIGNGNGLQLVNDMFEVDKGTISMITKELYLYKITKKRKKNLFLGTFRNLCIHFSLNCNQNAHLKTFPIHTIAFCFIKLKIFLLNNHPFCSFYFTIHIDWPHLFLWCKVAKLFFLDFHNSSYFVHKIRACFPKKNCILFTTRDPHMWRLGIPSYYLKCSTIEHSQKWSMIGKDNQHLLQILIPPLWLWGISMIHGSTKMWK